MSISSHATSIPTNLFSKTVKCGDISKYILENIKLLTLMEQLYKKRGFILEAEEYGSRWHFTLTTATITWGRFLQSSILMASSLLGMSNSARKKNNEWNHSNSIMSIDTMKIVYNGRCLESTRMFETDADKVALSERVLKSWTTIVQQATGSQLVVLDKLYFLKFLHGNFSQ